MFVKLLGSMPRRLTFIRRIKQSGRSGEHNPSNNINTLELLINNLTNYVEG